MPTYGIAAMYVHVNVVEAWVAFHIKARYWFVCGTMKEGDLPDISYDATGPPDTRAFCVVFPVSSL